jgi:large subunit ribosomal protein L25
VQELKLKLKLRDVHGKKARKIIENGGIIGNVFGKGQASQSVEGEYRAVSKTLESAGNQPIQLEIEGGKDELALVKKIETQPLTGRIHHVEFHIIHRGEKVTTEVPLKMTGDAPAERTGKIVVTMLDLVEIEATPTNIPESIDVDMSSLVEENDSIVVGDIKAPQGVEILTEKDHMIAKVEVPRAQVELEAEEAEAASAADVPSEHGKEDSAE